MLNGRRIISLCTSRLNDIESSRFVTGLNRSLNESDASLFIYNINTDLYWDDSNIRAEAAVFGLVNYDVTDIVIIMYERIKNKTICDRITEEAKAHNVPVIIVDGAGEGCINICFDYKKGFEAITRHIIEKHGSKRPHFLAGLKDNVFSDERMEVFRKVVEENGIGFSEDMVSYGNFWAKPAREATEKIVASGNIPDAIICANDIMAINVCTVLQENGYKVPEDVIVSGFDGIDEINFSFPKITSAYCGNAGLVPAIIEAVKGIFEKGVLTGEYHAEPELLLDESCGCERTETISNTNALRNFNDRFYRYQDDHKLLSSISESMLNSNDILDCACKMFSDVLSDMTCIINKDCIKSTHNYFAGPSRMDFDEEMFVFFERDASTFRQRPFKRADMIPNIERALGTGSPVIFNVISFLNMPLGYVCFYYKDYDVVDYCKIPQIVNAIGSGLGGFVNLKYQLYLTSRIERMYKFDSLTGLYNRLGFNKEFEKRMTELMGSTVPVTVILADLDGLKYINDNYGHGAGDNAIHTVAKAMSKACPEEALSVRFGGDEMLTVITGDCVPEQIKYDIQQYLKRYNSRNKNPYIIAASIGIYRTDTSSDIDFDSLVRGADMAMYEEKLAKRKKL